MNHRTLYLRPDKNWALLAAVAASIATDTDHDLSWLTDGRPAFPLRLQGGSATITLTKAAGEVTLVLVGHHLLDAGLTITIAGDRAGSVVIPAYAVNGIPFNAFALVESAGYADVDTLTLTITGNSTDILIGEVMAGEFDVLEPSFRLDDLQFSIDKYLNTQSSNPLSGIPPYSERAESRSLSGSLYAASTQDLGPLLEDVLDWWRSEDAFPYPVPSVLITDEGDPTSAKLVRFASKPTWREVPVAGADPYYLIQLSFVEYPRTRW
jgi:hypothetical protein